MVAQGRHKYVRTLEAGEPEELYDLLADPEELTNLAQEPSHRATVEKLRAATIAELRRTGAKMANSLPPVLTTP
jgi:choline-sulfatase